MGRPRTQSEASPSRGCMYSLLYISDGYVYIIYSFEHSLKHVQDGGRLTPACNPYCVECTNVQPEVSDTDMCNGSLLQHVSGTSASM